MPILGYILGTSLVISLVALVGLSILYKSESYISKLVFMLVGLSTGTLLGGAFFHLIPESLEVLSTDQTFMLLLVSFCLFFLLEKYLHWHHCHDEECETHTLGYINLVGDFIHNFIDGIILASAFLVDIRLGLITSAALITHELPQELGDFAVLLHSGFKKEKALLYNFIVALAVVLGGLVGYFAVNVSQNLLPYMLPVAAGGFLYISTSDLIPELKKETNFYKSLNSFLLFLVGVVIMYALKFLE